MLFNSLEFAFFLPIVFILYWLVVNRNLRLQNTLLLAASYFFYGWWDWRFLSLIIFSSIVDYTIGLQLSKTTKETTRKGLLLISILVNLGLLGFFKYFNFFVESFVDAFTLFGLSFTTNRLDIILPIGISFYTFQTLSYTIDIYKNKLKPSKDIIVFFTYVSFFPQLVAGPIERATNLLPQFFHKRKFEYAEAKQGVRQILWGFFKKVVIADACAVEVNNIYQYYDTCNSATLILGAFLFSIQIYCDFSGYSDIAIGTAKLFGFKLMQNFAFPYFATNITDFWRRWHISLSTWFGDYLYRPIALMLRGYGLIGLSLTLLISFTVIGFWHGAGWSFIVFGLLHGIALVYELHTKKERKRIRKKSNKKIYNLISVLLTMIFWIFTLIFFRSPDLSTSFHFIDRIFSLVSGYDYINRSFAIRLIPFYIMLFNIILLFIIEWNNRGEEYGMVQLSKNNIFNIFMYIYFSNFILNNLFSEQEFIYFQF